MPQGFFCRSFHDAKTFYPVAFSVKAQRPDESVSGGIMQENADAVKFQSLPNAGANRPKALTQISDTTNLLAQLQDRFQPLLASV